MIALSGADVVLPDRVLSNHSILIADGIIQAVNQVGVKVPVVARLEGTNVDLGKKIIRESGLNFIPADDLDDAASKIVKAVKEAA